MSRFWRRQSDDSEREREAEQRMKGQHAMPRIVPAGRQIVSLAKYREGMTSKDFSPLCDHLKGFPTHVHRSLTTAEVVHPGDLLSIDADGFEEVLREISYATTDQYVRRGHVQ